MRIDGAAVSQALALRNDKKRLVQNFNWASRPIITLSGGDSPSNVARGILVRKRSFVAINATIGTVYLLIRTHSYILAGMRNVCFVAKLAPTASPLLSKKLIKSQPGAISIVDVL